MQQQRGRRSRLIFGFLSLGLLAGAALTASSAQAATSPGPYYAEPAWAQKLDSAKRFVVLTNWFSEAVLDKETGLVWEKSPQVTTPQWREARIECANKNVGGRRGWRLPSVVELASLIDPAVGVPALPSGHPFLNIIGGAYWSASTNAADPTLAWVVRFCCVEVDQISSDGKTDINQMWCVRGGMNADQY